MFLKIADLCFDVTMPSELLSNMYDDYVCDNADAVDSCITIEKEDVIAEYNLACEHNAAANSKKELASLALYRKICAVALKNQAFLMHGALIEYEGKGYLFTAKSGTGKTTHINLWKQVFGEDKVTVVNGDKPIIRFIEDRVYAYGTPWCGKEGYNVNTKVELCALVFVDRAVENSISKISDTLALPRIFSQIMIADSADLEKQLELVDRLLEKVPTYLLKCNMEPDAAIVAYSGMAN